MDDRFPSHPNLDSRYWSSLSQFLSVQSQEVTITLQPHMTTHIANCGYSSLFTRACSMSNLASTQPRMAKLPRSICQTSPSPEFSTFLQSAHQVPSSAEPPKQRRPFRIAALTSHIKSSLFSVGTMCILNRRSDVNRRNPFSREHNGSYHISQTVSRIKR